MARRPHIPPGLKLGAFTLAQARAAGITPTALRGKSWLRLERGIYCWSEVMDDPWRLLLALQRLHGNAIFAGRTSAWIHGLKVDPADPIEIIVSPRSGMRSRRGFHVRRIELSAADVVFVRGLRATGAHRTLSDLCPRLGGVDALALLDSALLLKIIDRTTLINSGSMTLRKLGPLAEPAESPMETRLRWLLIKSGLPRPEVQVNLYDAQGPFLGRADLYYPDCRLVIECDGGTHRDRLVEDNRRQNRLLNSGFRLLRFTAADIYNRPETIAAHVRRALSGGAAISARRQAAAPR